MRFLFTSDFGNISYGLGRALYELGHKVEIVDLAAMFKQDPSYLYELLTYCKPDYVVADGGWYDYWDSLVRELNRRSIPLIYWAREDPVFFDALSLPYSHCARYVFTTAEESIPEYAAHGIKARLMMFACLPSFHYRVAPEARFMHDLLLIGTNFARFDVREKGIDIILRPLIKNRYNVRIYGNDWWMDQRRPFSVEKRFYGGQLSYEETRVAYSSSRIALGIHSVNTSSTMMSMRTFEALGCGAFFLTQWTPAIENLFKNHTHLVWSKSPDETIELVDYYLSHDDERARIARQGQAEVYAKHTYLHRAHDFLKAVNALNKTSGQAYALRGQGYSATRQIIVQRPVKYNDPGSPKMWEGKK